MTHPYQTLPSRAFWRNATANNGSGLVKDLYQPKFTVTPDTRIGTAGSCFASHIGGALRQAGCHLIDAEPPLRSMSAALATRFGYGVYLARYGNIYTPRQFRELLEETREAAPDPPLIWQKDGRFYDALRQGVEPDGFSTQDEAVAHRQRHLSRLSDALPKVDLFILTLGLTEAWIDTAVGRILPVCPGVIAGTFDPKRHLLHQFNFLEVSADLAAIQSLLAAFNPKMKLLLTVSPVPLTASASGEHVLTATMTAKATLRAATAEHVAKTDRADYFPAYEIVTSPAAGGPFFDRDQRTVTSAGVARVMAHFFAGHRLDPKAANAPAPREAETEEDTACEDILLGAFAP